MAEAAILPLIVSGLAYAAGTVHPLAEATFRLEPGTRNIVLGANGAGKSVLLRLLHGLLLPTAGRIDWAAPNAQGAQAMVFQRPVMLRRSVRENLEFALAVANAAGDHSQLAHAALEEVGLAHLAERPARLCSGGEQQRIALARARVLRPQLLFLDEPTASLDPAATRAVEEAVLSMHKAGTTILMTTHDLGQARRLAERILFLHAGRLVEDALAQEFFQRPRSQEAAAFIKGELP